MGRFQKYLYPAVTAFFALTSVVGPAGATDVGALLDELREAEAARAAQIIREVERSWDLSGSTSLDYLFRRGEESLKAQDWTAAIEHFTAVTDHAPDFAAGWRMRATAYYQAEKFGPAAADLGRALTLNPDDWNALFGLAILLDETDQYARSADALEILLDLNPHHKDAKDALDRVELRGVGRAL